MAGFPHQAMHHKMGANAKKQGRESGDITGNPFRLAARCEIDRNWNKHYGAAGPHAVFHQIVRGPALCPLCDFSHSFHVSMSSA
jgi:hypothetical protein